MVVPKRTALLLDRIMVALHHALEDNDTEGIQRIANLHKINRNSGKNLRFEKGMLQQIKGERVIHWCYALLFDIQSKVKCDAHNGCASQRLLFFVFSLMHFLFVFSFTLQTASGAENDLNYLEIPMDIDSFNDIDGRLSADDAVGVEF